MADATTARSDDASRTASPRLQIPALSDTTMDHGHTHVFYSSGEPYIEQAYALLEVLKTAFSASDEIVNQKLAGADGRDRFTTLADARGHTLGLAMEGVQSLLGLARHMDDVFTINEHNHGLDSEGR
ncbi:MAG: hypothetical protein C0494_12600 [Sphingobium sp.]|nr:hypothetical protein [Sphingobium sp.]